MKRARRSLVAALLSFTSAHQQAFWAAIQTKLAPQTGHVFCSVLSPAEGALGSPVVTAIAPY